MKLYTLTCIGILTELAYSRDTCIKREDGVVLVERMRSVLEQRPSDIGDFVTTAERITADPFVFFSNSVRAVLGQPVRFPRLRQLHQLVTNRSQLDVPVGDRAQSLAYKTQISAPYNGTETLDITIDCHSITWHFDFGVVGSGKYPVKGFALMDLTPDNTQMKSLNLEFDSFSYALNTGLQAT